MNWNQKRKENKGKEGNTWDQKGMEKQGIR